MKCYLFDIDGTLADCSHRIHHIQKEPKDWKQFFAACGGDQPIWPVINLLMILFDHDEKIVLVSGRSDECRARTEDWLFHQGVPDLPLYMRKAGDHRDD